MTKEKLSSLLVRLWRYLSPRGQKQFGLLFLLIVLSSFAEVFSIGALLPFLGILTSPDRVFDFEYIKPAYKLFNITSHEQLLLPFTLIFIFAVLFAGVVRLFLLWASARLSAAAGSDLSIDIYRKTLYQSYNIHVSRNSSEVVSGIVNKASGIVAYFIMPVINILGAILIIGSIFLALISISPLVYLSILFGFALIYGLISFFSRKHLSVNSEIVSREYTRVYKSLQEGLGGIRDVLLDGTQNFYCDLYKTSEFKLRKANSELSFIVGSPRFVIEAAGMMLIAAFAYISAKESSGLNSILPLLGSLALGAQRVLPVLQQGYY